VADDREPTAAEMAAAAEEGLAEMRQRHRELLSLDTRGMAPEQQRRHDVEIFASASKLRVAEGKLRRLRNPPIGPADYKRNTP
jgi:hypothetical protein